MKNTTLCLLVKNNEILLSRKKTRLGIGKYNGYGGHVKENETPEAAAIRELREETRDPAKEGSGLIGLSYEKAAELTYIFKDSKMKEWDELVHVYLVKDWKGIPKETDEMSLPEKFSLDRIPYEEMWDNDKYWLPFVLRGSKIKATIHHDNDIMYRCELKEIDEF